MNKLAFLQKTPLFTEVAQIELEAISQLMFEKQLRRAETVLIESDLSDTLFIVAEGVVKLFKISIDGKEQILGLVRPNEMFNAVAVFDGGLVPINAQALGAVTLYGITRDNLIAALHNNPALAQRIIRMLSQRIRSLTSLVEDLSFRNVVSRVAKILLENLSEPTYPPIPKLTQREMAAMAGTAREVVARSLKYLEGSGLIEIRSHRIAIRNKKGLEQVVELGL